MLTYQERLDKMLENFHIEGWIPEHYKLACKVLSKLTKELLKKKIGYLEDDSWLFHIVVPDGIGRWISLQCGGFSRRIDIMLLTRSGMPDNRFKERSFLTPMGAANFLVSYINKHGRLGLTGLKFGE